MPVTNRWDSRQGRSAMFDEWWAGINGGRNISNPGDFFNDISQGGPRRDPNAAGRGPTTNANPDLPAPGGGDGTGDAGGAGGTTSIMDAFRGYGGSLGGGGFNFGGGGGGGGGGLGGSLQIAERMMANEGQLRSIDAETEAELAKVKEAELMALQKTMGEQSAQFLENMFGRGIARSTIAGRVGEQLVASQGLAAAQVESNAAQRKIAIRQDISDRAIKEAQIATAELDSRRGYAVGMAGVAAENARTAASIKIASMETAANMAIAEGRLGLGYAELDLAREQFGFDQTKFWENLRRTDRGLDIREQQVKGEKRNGLLGFLGGLGGALLEFAPSLPFFSHPALKEDIEGLNEADILKSISELPMYKYKYLGENKERIGISSLEAFAADPRLSDGLTLDRDNLIMALLASVKALNAEIEELKNGR